MDRRDAIKVGLLTGSAFLLTAEGNRAQAAGHPTGGIFIPPSPTIKNEFSLELPRMTVKRRLPGGANDLLRPENGGVAPNGTVYPQVCGNDALTTYPNSLERIVASQQRNSGGNVQFPPKLFYVLNVLQKRHAFHSDPPYDKGSVIWGYDGSYPGPTFKSRYKEPILVRIINRLYDDPQANPAPGDIKGKSAPGTRFGDARITTHLHNGHTASESDGNPKDVYPPVDPTEVDPSAVPFPASILAIRFRDHHYGMFRAGLDRLNPITKEPPNINDGDIAETLSTLWYHDHSDCFTAENVYKGLVGFHLFFDDIDSDNEVDTNPKASRLPSGEFDIPLLIQDKRFNSDGELILDKVIDNSDGFLGDRFAVNGIIQPKVSVLRRKYRFRLLNAGPSRFYQFFLMKVTNDAPPKYEEHEFMHIGNDESLFVAALPTNSIILSVAERGDVVIDFTHFARGDRVFLVNRLKMQDTGMGPEFNSETNQMVLVPADQGDKILCFEVGEDAPDPSRVPGQLRCQPLLPSYLPKPLTANALKALDNHKLYEFVRDPLDFVWKINGKEFDGNAMRELIQQGPPEGKGYDGVVWTLKNQAGEVWSHPIHIHLEEFRILLRNGVEPPLNERCKKDVLFLAPKEEVQIFVRFRDFLGKYPMHCHNVVHEDMMMMLRYDIVGFNPQ